MPRLKSISVTRKVENSTEKEPKKTLRSFSKGLISKSKGIIASKLPPIESNTTDVVVSFLPCCKCLFVILMNLKFIYLLKYFISPFLCIFCWWE